MAGTAPSSSSDWSPSPIVAPASQPTTTIETVTVTAIATWTIGLARSGRSRSGIAANVGRIVP